MAESWVTISGELLRQGDYLPRCKVPTSLPGIDGDDEYVEVDVHEYDVIVVTQSCDLANNKVSLVAMCPVWPIVAFEEANPKFQSKRELERVRQGRVEGLYMLPSPENPDDNWSALIVDFGQIYSLPIDYAQRHAVGLNERSRLLPPFLEHFSQAFARYFMRVGLPSGIPPFKA